MPVRPLVAVCLVWGLVCAGLRLAWGLFPVAQAGVFECLSIGVCLYTAAWMTRTYLHRAGPRGIQSVSRAKWTGSVLLVWLCIYGLTAAGLAPHWFAGILTLVLILFACTIGDWLAGHLKRPAEIVPLAVTAALADMFSVAKGPTKAFSEQVSAYYQGGMKGVPPLVDFILVKFPIPEFMPVFGVTDWIVAAFLSAAALRFNMRDNLLPEPWPGVFYFPSACAGLAAAIVVAGALGLFIPALPFSVCVYLAFMMPRYPEMRDLTRAELLPLIGVSAVLVGLMILI